MHLEACRVRLEDRHLVLVPRTRRGRRRQPPVSVDYRDIAQITIVEPVEGGRRALALRLTDGATIATSFPARSTLKMRSIHHQAWKRVRAARAAPATESPDRVEKQKIPEP